MTRESEPAPALWVDFAAAASAWGVTLDSDQVNAFRCYLDQLCDWNRRFNLTRISAPEEVVAKHFLDSLSCALAGDLRSTETLLDVGSGPGFPGLPLKIAFPELQVTLLDSTAKKLRFIDRVCESLGLAGVRTLHLRAEEAALRPDLREKFDCVTARAVAPLARLAAWTVPFARVGGRVIAMKGPQVEEEVAAAADHLKAQGGEVEEVRKLELPIVPVGRSLVIIRKVNPTPAPEHAGQAGVCRTLHRRTGR